MEGEKEFHITTSMEKNNNEKAVTKDEPEVKHMGIKAMPFVIGKK